MKYKELLSKEGLKSTIKRNAIIEILKNKDIPVSVEDILSALTSKGIKTSPSTIYRNLEVLISKNIVQKTTLLDDDRAKFCLTHEGHHHHLICLNCNKTLNIDVCPISKLEKALDTNTDFKITGHKLELYGYCSNCQ